MKKSKPPAPVLPSAPASKDDLVAFPRLRRAWQSARLGSAVVLWGPAPAGQRAAQALARHLLCEGDDPGPCRACRAPLDSHPDFRRVSAEGRHLKLDQVQSAVGSLELRPLWAKARVIWLDEADRLTVEAQNALLKALEEPPQGAYWLLGAERPDRLLPTIRSRCQTHRVGHSVWTGVVEPPAFLELERLEEDLVQAARWARRQYLESGDGRWLSYWQKAMMANQDLEGNGNRDLIRESMRSRGRNGMHGHVGPST